MAKLEHQMWLIESLEGYVRVVCPLDSLEEANSILDEIYKLQSIKKKLVEALEFAIATIKDMGINIPSGTLPTKDKVKKLEKLLSKAKGGDA